MKSDRSLARAVSFPRVINIHDFRRLAKRRLPAVVFAYIDGGAEDEVTLRENCLAFGDFRFRPRQCVAVPSCDLRTTVLGTTFDLPFLLTHGGPNDATTLFALTAYTLSLSSGLIGLGAAVTMTIPRAKAVRSACGRALGRRGRGSGFSRPS